MSWSYRILEKDGWFALHEVFYSADGTPSSWTAEPITFICMADEGRKGIVDSLTTALADAFARPVLKIDGDKLVAKP